jgi:6-phosphogluconate dehydrogenase
MSKEQGMQVGVVGLGKMGAIVARRLLRGGHDVSGVDTDAAKTAALEADGLQVRPSLEALVAGLETPRLLWLMLPSGTPVEAVVRELESLLEPGDAVVEGGNSDFRDSLRRAEQLARGGLELLDVGVSGGIWGLEDGCGLLVGGTPEGVARSAAAFDSVAARDGWIHVGPAGAGHYAKMVHNAVEYGVMQAYAEGYELLRSAPMPVDAAGTVEVWSVACSIRAWLLEHLATVLGANPDLDGVPGRVGDSGQGRWAVEQAIDDGVPIPAIAAAMFARFGSQRDDAPAMRAIAALREQVGGHRPHVPA